MVTLLWVNFCKCLASKHRLSLEFHFVVFFKVLHDIEKVYIISDFPFIKTEVAFSGEGIGSINVATIYQMSLNHD